MQRTKRSTTCVGASVIVLFVLAVGVASDTSAHRSRSVAARPAASGVLGRGADALGLDRLAVPPAATQTPPEATPAPAPPGEVVIAPPPPVFDAAPDPPPPPPPALRGPSPFGRASPSGGTWAVMIGVNDYPGRGSDLRAAVNDANDMDQALAGLGVPANQRLVLRDGQATASMIGAAVDWLVANAAPDATAVFFYSGHVRKLGRTTEAMVAADGRTIVDDELGARLARLQARRAWIAMVACYGGGFTEALAPGRVLTAAASADSLAYETSLFGRSYMVQYMVREALIERRTGSTVQAAFAYARSELGREHPGRQPVQIDAGPGPLDLRPGANVGPAPAPAGDPAPPPPGAGGPPTPPTTSPPSRSCLLIVCSG
ncbi:MAG: caspase family protein [Actinomycetota bacterium]|nr:caspase family protein [Actinomycetota bacterium]